MQSVGSADDEGSGVERPVRACTECARAKARCTPGPRAGQACARCFRMKKSCEPSPPMRKRRKVSDSTASHKIEKLEETLSGLMSLIKSATQPASSPFNGLQNLPTPPHISRPLANHLPGSSNSVNDGTQSSHTARSVTSAFPLTPATSSPSATSVMGLPFHVDVPVEIGLDDAELFLQRFRTYFLDQMPFFALNVTSARQLRQESPMLWLVIMNVAHNRSAEQRILSKELRAVFGREAFVNDMRNMDFLLAVMCFVTWDRYADKSLATSLVQLAISIVYDLGLDKPAPNNPGAHLEYELKGMSKPSRLTRTPTMDERRALMGCYLLSSVPAIAPKGHPLRWTPYFEECLQTLASSSSLHSDALLVSLVKLRLISDRALELSWPNHPFSTSALSSSSSPSPFSLSSEPLRTSSNFPFYIRSLQSQLNTFKSTLPSSLKHNRTLLLETHHTEMTIHELALSPSPSLFPPDATTARFDSLLACLNAADAWCELFLSHSAAQFVGFSVYTYMEMMRVLIVVWRLTTLDCPQWDRGFVAEVTDVMGAMGRAERLFAEVKDAVGLDVDVGPTAPVGGGGGEKGRGSTTTTTTSSSSSSLPPPDFYSMMSAKMGMLAGWWVAFVVPVLEAAAMTATTTTTTTTTDSGLGASGVVDGRMESAAVVAAAAATAVGGGGGGGGGGGMGDANNPGLMGLEEMMMMELPAEFYDTWYYV